MSQDDILAFVHRALRDIAPDVDPTLIDPDASMRDELDLDSMDFLALVRAIHEELGVDVPESDYARVESIRGCVEYVAARVEGG